MIFSDITYNGITFKRFVRTAGYMAALIKGDQVGIRDTENPLPGVDGTERYKSLYGERLIELRGFIKSDGENDLYTKIEALKAAFDIKACETASTDGYGFLPLGFTDPGQAAAVYYCKPIKSAIAISDERTGFARSFVILLEAKDPKKYTASAVTVTIDPSLATTYNAGKLPAKLPVALEATYYTGTKVFNNTGSAAVTPTLIKVYGPCVAPKITNSTKSQYIGFTGEVQLLTGEYILIDPVAGTALKYVGATSTSIIQYLITGSIFWQLAKGNNTLLFEAEQMGSAAKVDVTARLTA